VDLTTAGMGVWHKQNGGASDRLLLKLVPQTQQSIAAV